MQDPASIGRRRYAAAFAVLVGATQALIVLGAMVRAHQAGLACPDWPLCFGELVPRMNVGVAFEWSHRVLAGSVATGFVTLAVLVLRRGDTPRETRRWLAVGALLLTAQVLLGALTVWRLLASWTVTSHLLTGNAFALTVLFVTQSLRGRRRRGRTEAPLRAAVSVLAGLLALQMALGGLVSSRFAGLACTEWPACNGGVWFPSLHGSVGLHLLHRWNGTLLAALTIAFGFAARRDPALRRPAALAAALAGAQVVAGIANVLLRIPVEITGLHSALAALLVLTIGSTTRTAWGSPAAAASSGGAGPPG